MSSTSIPFSLPLPAGITLDSTLGMLFVATVLSSIFYGVTLLQTLIYFGMYTKDRLLLKALVTALWFVSLPGSRYAVYGIVCTRGIYLVTFFANPLGALSMVWSMAASPVISSIIAFIVHLFLAYRIKQLVRTPLWNAIACIVAVVSLFPMGTPLLLFLIIALETDNVLLSSRFLNNMNLMSQASGVNDTPSLRWVVITTTSTSSAIDLFIALTICYQLYQERSKVKSTQGMINIISLYVITSGMITTLVNMVSLITSKYLAANETEVVQIFNSMIPKAYVNTLMAT
ncbi:hypothetical protein V5O48_012233 [Marasmius crinis-equi]|uniref:DUF6534 domain-containing protein n=1 Tax=Marasmius crinis-equi TaxID=585013 RepID=A0ABR3F3Q4_9AGAR